MKNILFALSLFLTTYFSYAKSNSDSSTHLTFKGVPLDGTLDQYVARMKQKEFTLLRTENGIATLQGEFAGYKDCYLNVSTLKQKDLVHKIEVFFPSANTWSTLLENYLDLKQMLLEKYGKLYDEAEKCHDLSPDDEDRVKILAVRMDRCKYYSIWKFDKGEIQLLIGHTNRETFVKLAYIDKTNSVLVKKQAIEDL
jgi:hypothetical protein